MNTFRSRTPGLCRKGRSYVWSLGSLATVPLIVFVVCALAMPQLGYAATFEVNNTADIADANPGDGQCETTPGNGVCTLRAAIQESNASPGFPPEQVNLSAGTYVLTEGRLEINNSLFITGSGPDSAIIDGNNRSGILLISNPGTHPIVHISGVTIRNGQGGIDFGTGIFISQGSSLFLANSVVSDNESAVGGVGISNSGFLTLFRSTVRDNQVTGGGGGVTGTGGWDF